MHHFIGDCHCGERAVGALREAFGCGFLPAADAGRVSRKPAIDVYRGDGALHVVAEVPGFSPGEIDIDASSDSLRMSGRRSAPGEGLGQTCVRECLQGGFSRCVTLPGEVDAGSASAELENGILHVVLPLAGSGVTVRIRPE